MRALLMGKYRYSDDADKDAKRDNAHDRMFCQEDTKQVARMFQPIGALKVFKQF